VALSSLGLLFHLRQPCKRGLDVRRLGLIGVIYLVIGVVVALDRGYLKGIGDIGNLISALLAVVLWPLIMLGIDVKIGDGKGKQSLGQAHVYAAFVLSSSRRVGLSSLRKNAPVPPRRQPAPQVNAT
jgi:hypothetical protein